MKTKALIAGVVLLTLSLGSNATARTVKPQLTKKPAALSSESFKDTLLMRDTLRELKSRVNRTSYVFSGVTPKGWDCSGLVVWTYAQLGHELPHSADAQAHIGTRVSAPKPGDIVVFAYQGRTDFYHSAVYIGGGKVINANRMYGTTVIEPLSHFKRSQIRFVRIVETTKL